MADEAPFPSGRRSGQYRNVAAQNTEGAWRIIIDDALNGRTPAIDDQINKYTQVGYQRV